MIRYQGLANYVGGGGPNPATICFVNKMILKHSHTDNLHVIYGCFPAIVAELKSCNIDIRPACKVENVYSKKFVEPCHRQTQFLWDKFGLFPNEVQAKTITIMIQWGTRHLDFFFFLFKPKKAASVKIRNLWQRLLLDGWTEGQSTGRFCRCTLMESRVCWAASCVEKRLIFRNLSIFLDLKRLQILKGSMLLTLSEKHVYKMKSFYSKGIFGQFGLKGRKKKEYLNFFPQD